MTTTRTGDHPGDHPRHTTRDHPQGPPTKTPSDLRGPLTGTTGDHHPARLGTRPPPYRGTSPRATSRPGEQKADMTVTARTNRDALHEPERPASPPRSLRPSSVPLERCADIALTRADLGCSDLRRCDARRSHTQEAGR